MFHRRRFLSCVLALGLVSPLLAEDPKYDPFAPAPGSGPRPSGAVSLSAKPAAKDVSNAIANVEFVDSPITSIFKMISDLTGWTIVMSPSVSEKPPKINIWIKNQTPDQVLDQVAMLGGLVLQRKGGTIQVMTVPAGTGPTEIHLIGPAPRRNDTRGRCVICPRSGDI